MSRVSHPKGETRVGQPILVAAAFEAAFWAGWKACPRAKLAAHGCAIFGACAAAGPHQRRFEAGSAGRDLLDWMKTPCPDISVAPISCIAPAMRTCHSADERRSDLADKVSAWMG